jgi:hypothetical protein
MKKVAILILVVLLPVGLIVWNFIFHPATRMVLTAVIIWLAGVSWLVITLVDAGLENLQARVRRQEERTKELRALIKQKKF